MRRTLILLAFSLPLLISPFGASDLLISLTRVVAQEPYHAAMNTGHTSVLTVKSVVEQTVSKISLE